MQAIINFNDFADIPSFKKILENFRGIKDFKILNESDEEMLDKEYNEKFIKLLEISSRQIDEGQGREMTREYLDEIFSKWK